MTPILTGLVIGLVCAAAVVCVVLLGLGLCRAAAMQSDAMPHDVREDTGEYQ